MIVVVKVRAIEHHLNYLFFEKKGFIAILNESVEV